MLNWTMTQDGSYSLHHQALDEGYHNRAGAYTEALTNYVSPSGLVHRYGQGKPVQVIDACFGLGYNTFALIEQAWKTATTGSLVITAIDTDPELFPCWPVILAQPCFAALAPLIRLFQALNPTLPVQTLELNHQGHQLSLTLRLGGLETELPAMASDQPQTFDGVFHDAFSPKKMPHLWEPAVLGHYATLLKSETGCLLTYSRAPGVLEVLTALGFTHERTPALGAKRGGTIARLTPAKS
jgi:tRNA U34 5-methylaminomethyl-2-thiouridine-forming methyltransferase MnmC